MVGAAGRCARGDISRHSVLRDRPGDGVRVNKVGATDAVCYVLFYINEAVTTSLDLHSLCVTACVQICLELLFSTIRIDQIQLKSTPEHRQPVYVIVPAYAGARAALLCVCVCVCV